MKDELNKQCEQLKNDGHSHRAVAKALNIKPSDVNWALRINRKSASEAMTKAKCRCEKCGAGGMIHFHHLVYGDTPSLQVLCAKCHANETQKNIDKNRTYIGISGAKWITFREEQVLHLVCQGYTSSAIAVILKISIKTVEKHRMKLFASLGANCAVLAVTRAIALGIIEIQKIDPSV